MNHYVIQTQRYIPAIKARQVYHDHAKLASDELAKAHATLKLSWADQHVIASGTTPEGWPFETIANDDYGVEVVCVTRVTCIDDVEDLKEAFDEVDWYPWNDRERYGIER